MNDHEIVRQAEDLAARPYQVVIALDETTDDQPIYLVLSPELPGCMAQGETITEALESLYEARVDYIMSLLEDGLAVPSPNQYATRTGAAGINLSATQSSITVVPQPQAPLRDDLQIRKEITGAPPASLTQQHPELEGAKPISTVTVIQFDN